MSRMKHLVKYLSLAVAFSGILFLACPNGDQGSVFPVENVLLNFYTAVPAPAPPGGRVEIPLDLAGVIHTGYSANLDLEYDLLREMSARWVHRDFSWNRVQPDLGCDVCEEDCAIDCATFETIANNWNFEWLDEYVQRANREGKLVMGMLLYDTPWIHRKYPREDRPTDGGEGRRREVRKEQVEYFVRYAVETVRRYNRYVSEGGHGKVHSWFIWNEPCLQPRFWTWEQEDFFYLTYRTAKAIRPYTDAYIVGGVFSGHALMDPSWIDGLLKSDAMDFLDGIGFHPYGPSPNAVRNFYDMFRNRVYQTAPDFVDKIWLNEIGYPTFPDRGSMPPGRMGIDQYEGNMPEVVTQTFALLAAAGARNIMWYHMFDRYNRDHGDNFNNSERWFGLVWQTHPERDWLRKGGYWGFALSARHLPGTAYVEMDFFPDGSAPVRFQTHHFVGENGRRVLLAWNDCREHIREVTITLGSGSRDRRLWNVVDGSFGSIGTTSTHRLYPLDSYQRTLVFITWYEDD